MDVLFLKILNMSISASWLILAIILFRALLKKAPKWINCALWVLVAVRLLYPISFESSMSLVPNPEPVPLEIFMVEPPETHTDTIIDSTANPNLPDVPSTVLDTTVDMMQTRSVYANATLIWISGVAAMIAYAAISCIRVRRKVKASLRLRDRIWICDNIQTPFILGCFKPKIYIPSGTDEVQLPHIIAHENAHLKRCDHWWKPFGYLVLAIHWFNPLVWIAYILLCRDIELACDEKVIRELNQSESIAYSEALLSCSVNRRTVMICPLAFGEVGVKERVKRVLNYKKPAFWIVVVAVVASIVLGVCFLTNPKGQPLHAPEPFAHSYRVESISYDAAHYNFAYTPETAPLYNLTSDCTLMILEDKKSNEWLQAGGFTEIALNEGNFDEYFRIDAIWDGTSANELRKNNEKAWKAVVSPDIPDSVFYYLMLQENGDVYLTYGYFNPANNADKKSDDSSIRWVFKLARYDLLSCNAVSDGLNCYIEPSYYPNGFDFDYKSVVAGSINDKGALVFDVDWDTDALIISEDYYAHGNIIEKETYELERNADGKFVLEVARRNDENEHANYFIKGESGTYVLHIDFPFAPKTTDLDTAIHNAIMEHNKDRYYKGVFTCESHIVLATEAGGPASAGQIGTLTVYALALYEEYDLSEEGIQSVSGGCSPVALTFHVTETGYALSEYWESGDGADYSDDIRDKFPEDVLDTIWNPQNHVDALKAENHQKALDFSAQKGGFQ